MFRFMNLLQISVSQHCYPIFQSFDISLNSISIPCSSSIKILVFMLILHDRSSHMTVKCRSYARLSVMSSLSLSPHPFLLSKTPHFSITSYFSCYLITLMSFLIDIKSFTAYQKFLSPLLLLRS